MRSGFIGLKSIVVWLRLNVFRKSSVVDYELIFQKFLENKLRWIKIGN